MEETQASKIRNRFGYYADRQVHDDHWVRINPTVTVQECDDLFAEMTKEVFSKHADLLENTSLMVHLAFPPNKLRLFPGENVSKEDALEPNYDSNSYDVRLAQGKEIILESGTLKECFITYANYASKYNFWYFTHNDSKKYEKYITDKFRLDGIELYHEWYFVYLSPGAQMGKHLDYLHHAMRYSFSVRQPETDRSITIGETNYYIPAGTAYIMDGTIPHEVSQTAESPRIMLLGAVVI